LATRLPSAARVRPASAPSSYSAPPRTSTGATTLTLRRVGGRRVVSACANAADADKTSGPTATRGSSYTARPLALPRFLISRFCSPLATESPTDHRESVGEAARFLRLTACSTDWTPQRSHPSWLFERYA
jgi:hypothetical protein